ncbi:unnamed protein product, partial [Polarella glacialis]
MAGALSFLLTGIGGAAVLFLFMSFTTMDPTEMALQYNFVLKTVNPSVVIMPGLKFVGPFSTLIRYPKTIQTIEYNEAEKDLLDGRTKDGLPLILGLAFQYRILPDGLFKLYSTFDNEPGDYIQIYTRVGMHIITELATKFTAYQFFNEKQKIAEVMRSELNKYFTENLFATVESLQIQE